MAFDNLDNSDFTRKIVKRIGRKNLEITEHVTVLNLTNLISQEKWTKKLGLKTRDNVRVLIDNFDFTRKKKCKIVNLNFLTGGQGQTKCSGADGLAQALNVFDYLDKKRSNYLKPNHAISRYVIYVANSPAYEMPVSDVQDYLGLSVDDVIKKLTDRNIYMSVISPRKIPQLVRMFSMSGGDVQKHKDSVNYAKDGTQLVLLNGFELQKRPFVSKADSLSQQTQQNQQQQQQAVQPQPTPQPQVQQQQQQLQPQVSQAGQMGGQPGQMVNFTLLKTGLRKSKNSKKAQNDVKN